LIQATLREDLGVITTLALNDSSLVNALNSQKLTPLLLALNMTVLLIYLPLAQILM